MAENSSLRKTFSTSRFAIMLPAVARRSPARTTPPSQAAATMVVACGRSRMAWPGVPWTTSAGTVPPGSRPGECEARKSVNEEVCRFMNPAGGLPAAPGTRPDILGSPANGPDWLRSRYEPNADLLP